MDGRRTLGMLHAKAEQWAAALESLRLQTTSDGDSANTISIAAQSAAIRWAIERELQMLRSALQPDIEAIIDQLEDLRAWAGAIAIANAA